MKKVDRKFLVEQVKLVLKEQEEQELSCVPLADNQGFFSKATLISLFVGHPDSWSAIGMDISRKMVWGSSKGSQYLKASYLANLKSPDTYMFRFIEPVLGGAGDNYGKVRLKKELFETYYKVIDFYAPKFAKVNLKAKGTTLGVFGEESLEQLYEDFIEKVEEVEEEYGLDDPSAGVWAYLGLYFGENKNPAARISRNTQATEEGIAQLASNMRKFLSKSPDIDTIKQRLEADIVLGIGDIYIKHNIRSFTDIYSYLVDKGKGGKMLDMVNAASFQRQIENSPVLGAYTDIIATVALNFLSFGGGGLAAKGAAKVGAKLAAQSPKMAKAVAAAGAAFALTSKIAGFPTTFLAEKLGSLRNIILANIQNGIAQGAVKVSTGAAIIGTKVLFSIPRALVEMSFSIDAITRKMDFQLGKFNKTFVVYSNLVKNQKYNASGLPSDSETLELVGGLVDQAKSFVVGQQKDGEGEQVAQVNEEVAVTDKKQYNTIKANLEAEMLKIFDAIEEAAYADYGGLMKKCGVPQPGLVEEKETRRNTLIASFKANPPELKVPIAFIQDMTAYTQGLEIFGQHLQKQAKKVASKTAELQKEVQKFEQTKKNMGIAEPEFILSRSKTSSSQSEPKDAAAAPQEPAPVDTPTSIQTSFGSNEKTSAEILRDLESELSKIQESQDPDVISVNIGYKDAIEFAKGNKQFSPENTKANIDKIIALVKSKGKKANITPIAAMVDSPEGVDKNKFDEFSKSINSYIQTRKVSTAKPSTVKPTQAVEKPIPADEPPSDRQVTQGKDVSDVSGPEILVIGDSTSHNIVDANPILRRGKKESRMGYYGKDGTKYDPKDFGGSHNKALAAAKKDGGGFIFPGYTGHASHGGAGTTYIKNSLSKLLARDESYVPKVAVISMGYNDPPSVSEKGTSIRNFKSIISSLKQRGVKDIRIIEPRADKGSYKRNADLIRPGVYDLADSVVKIVPNPTTQDGGPTRHDGVHYTAAGARKLFKDAMSGLTVSKDISPQTQAQSAKPESVPSKATSRGVPYNLVTSALGITKAQYDLYRVTLGQRESAQRYNIKGGAGGKYDGFYQMGTPAKIDSKIKLPPGASNWGSEVARKYFRENPAVQEEAFGKMTAKNMQYLNRPGKHTEKWEQLKQNPATKLGIMAVAHLLGHGGAKKFINNNLKTAGADAFGTKDAEYYNLIKNAIGGGSVAAFGGSAQTTDGSPGSESESVDLIAAANEVKSFGSLASFVYDILDSQGQDLKGIDGELSEIARDVDNTNLTAFKKNADTILKNIHKKRLPRIEAQFRRDIAAAGEDREKLELANKKVAYFHRPMFYSTVNVRKLKTLGTSDVSFAFEPGRNRASVNFDGGVEFYKQDYQDGSEMNKFVSKLSEINKSLEILLKKLDQFSKSEPGELRDIQVYQKSLSAFKKVLDKAIPVISDNTETALRRSYVTTVLNAALRKL